jgi:hypothetical protein
MRHLRPLAVTVLVAVSGSVAGIARAADDADALIKQGIELRKTGDHQGALRLFQRAYELRQSPRALAQVGLAEQALGNWADAEKHVGEAVVLFPNDPWIKKNAKVLETDLGVIREHVGILEIAVTSADGSKPDADLTVNGQPIDRALWSNKALHLSQGSTALRVEAPGYVGETRPIKITGNRTLRETFTLAPQTAKQAPKAPPVAVNAPAVAPRKDPAPRIVPGGGMPPDRPPPLKNPPVVKDRSDGGGVRRLAGGITGAAGIAAVGAGVYFALQVKKGSDDVTSASTFSQSAQDSALRAQTLEFVFLSAGAAAIVAGSLLYFWPASGAKAETSAMIEPVVGPGFTGALLALRL